MKTKKKLKLAKIISVAAMLGFLAAAFGMYFLGVYYATIAFVALEIIAAIAMAIFSRMSCEVYNYLDKELILSAGINGISLTYEDTKYYLDRTQKGSYNSIYFCTLEGGANVETMISFSKKIQGVKVNGNLLQKFH
ncbi:MAG: hypothetical protein K2N74_02295 [Clostridiales bacterium]|nr:hypothetical protein [Clostridiales bacterium]